MMVKYVQKKCLRFTFYIINIPFPPHDYIPIIRVLNLPSFVDRRRMISNRFLSGIISKSVDSPSLLAHINFRVPTHQSRNVALFRVSYVSNNFLINSPLIRLMRRANEDPLFVFEYNYSTHFIHFIFLLLFFVSFFVCLIFKIVIFKSNFYMILYDIYIL